MIFGYILEHTLRPCMSEHTYKHPNHPWTLTRCQWCFCEQETTGIVYHCGSESLIRSRLFLLEPVRGRDVSSSHTETCHGMTHPSPPPPPPPPPPLEYLGSPGPSSTSKGTLCDVLLSQRNKHPPCGVAERREPCLTRDKCSLSFWFIYPTLNLNN